MCSWTLDWVDDFGSMSLGDVKYPGVVLWGVRVVQLGYGIGEGFGSLNLTLAICIHVVEGFVILMQSVSSPADIPRRSLTATAT